MSDFEDWKAIDREALKAGLDAALSEAINGAMSANNAQELRTRLLTYARFLDLRKVDLDFLSVVVRLISFELERDYRTLILVIRQLYELGLFELCSLLCKRYIDEFEDHSDQAKLICAAAYLRIGQPKRASDVARTISDSKADTWIDGKILRPSDFGV